jgi:hypothetical protein
VRKFLLVAALVAALAGAAGVGEAAAAKPQPPSPYVLCSTCLPSGGGWTGCTSITADHSFSFPLIASVRHFLVVNYCKSYGIITSVSIAAHGCDVGGLMTCRPTVAWLTGGGTGSSSATFEAHATWSVTALQLYNNTDVLTLTVPAG